MDQWLTVWGVAAVAGTPQASAGDRTDRVVTSPQIAGERFRIRFTNRFASDPFVITHATLARQGDGASIRGPVRQVTWNGRAQTTIAPGRVRWSDPIPLAARAREELSISVHSRGASAPGSHLDASQFSYRSAPGSGDWTEQRSGERFVERTVSAVGVDRLQTRAGRGWAELVTLGDSITDGTGSTVGREQTWPEQLGRRLRALGLKWTVDNAGIAANALSGPRSRYGGRNAQHRLGDDVLSHRDAHHLIVSEGINDLQLGRRAAVVITALKRIIGRAERAGLKVSVATLTPSAYLSADNEEERRTVNGWIRSQHRAAVVDWDRAMRDPQDHSLLRPGASDDGLHPNDDGYADMAAAFEAGTLPTAGCRHR